MSRAAANNCARGKESPLKLSELKVHSQKWRHCEGNAKHSIEKFVEDRSIVKSANCDGWTSATVIHSNGPKVQTDIRIPRTNTNTGCARHDRHCGTQNGEQTREGQRGGWRVRRPALTFTLRRWRKIKHSRSPCVWGRQQGVDEGISPQEKEWGTKGRKRRRKATVGETQKQQRRNFQSCPQGRSKQTALLSLDER